VQVTSGRAGAQSREPAAVGGGEAPAAGGGRWKPGSRL
jgi:hypothetical protein